MILKHRDRELLRFEWREPEGVRIVSVNDVECKFLPLEMKGEATDESLEDFLCRRISQILEYGEKSDDLMLISQKNGGVNSAVSTEDGGLNSFFSAGESLGLQIKANLRADPFTTIKELSEVLNVPLRTVERKMKALREAGQIRRVGAAKNGHWEVNE